MTATLRASSREVVGSRVGPGNALVPPVPTVSTCEFPGLGPVDTPLRPAAGSCARVAASMAER